MRSTVLVETSVGNLRSPITTLLSPRRITKPSSWLSSKQAATADCLMPTKVLDGDKFLWDIDDPLNPVVKV